MSQQLSPVKLSPVFKDCLWGGEKLKTVYDKNTDVSPLAESWELSCHPNGMCSIASGPWKGKPFSEYIDYYSKEILGEKAKKFSEFPLLVKLIDAEQDLSIQVHPDDEYALINEKQYGKTEMWYVVESDPGAYLLCGFSRELSKEEIQRRIEKNTLVEVLNKVHVKKGDMFFIPPGTVHAICSGVVIAEIQQNSDVTYRVYDYNRKDSEGNARQLHIKQAIDVLNPTPVPEDFNKKGKIIGKNGAKITPLKKCNYFDVSLLEISSEFTLNMQSDSFVSLICLEGSYTLSWGNDSMDVKKGESIFIPAGFSDLSLNGLSTILKSKL